MTHKSSIYLIIFFIIVIHVKAQESKYFENIYGKTNGHKLYEKPNGNLMVFGDTYDSIANDWYGYILEMNKWGTIQYTNNNYESLGGIRDYVLLQDRYAICGYGEPVNGGLGHAHFVIIDEMGNSLDLKIVGDTTLHNSAYTILSITNNNYLLAGYAYIDNYETPYLIKLNQNGEVVWDSIYTNPAYTNNSRFFDMQPAPGGIYVIGTFNYTIIGPNVGDLILMKMDYDGNIIHEQLFDFGGLEIAAELLATNDGGLLIGGVDGAVIYQPFLIKLNAALEQEWIVDIPFYDGTIAGLVQLPDSTYVITGRNRNGSNSDMQIAKCSADGQEILWHRHYGGTGNDYGYDIITTQDGGFAVCGRTSSPPAVGADVYVVKTNCMGLLTEPEANFVYNLNQQVASLVNLSQYVYADSIDGGHYIWDFGDSSPTVNNKNPQHTYQENGNYTITLTAVVCSDTSTHTMPINVVGVGMETLNAKESWLQINPNPASTQTILNYQIPSNKTALFKLYDASGREIYQTKLQGTGSQILNTTTYPQGIYFYELLFENKVAENGKLIIIR